MAKRTRKKRKHHLKKVGLPPGSLIHVGTSAPVDVQVELVRYNKEEFNVSKVDKIDDSLKPKAGENLVHWIVVHGLKDISIIERIGKVFNLHHLVLEDILNTTQRPKAEHHDNFMFFTFREVFITKENCIDDDQISIILGKNFVISFHEKKADIYESLRERMRTAPEGKVRSSRADYLLYRLTDIVVDNYFIVIENLEERIEVLEDDIIHNPTQQSIHRIQELKGEHIMLRKAVYPLREAISKFHKEDSPFIEVATERYFSDIYDHLVQVIETNETNKDLLTGLKDIYMSAMSNRMNEVMKVLTIISTIFIPLTFIVGVYGMNFDYMPELRKDWGYPAVMIFMLAVGTWMVFYFKRKKWL